MVVLLIIDVLGWEDAAWLQAAKGRDARARQKPDERLAAAGHRFVSFLTKAATALSISIRPVRAPAPQFGKSIQASLNPSIIGMRGSGLRMPSLRKISSQRARR